MAQGLWCLFVCCTSCSCDAAGWCLQEMLPCSLANVSRSARKADAQAQADHSDATTVAKRDKSVTATREEQANTFRGAADRKWSAGSHRQRRGLRIAVRPRHSRCSTTQLQVRDGPSVAPLISVLRRILCFEYTLSDRSRLNLPWRLISGRLGVLSELLTPITTKHKWRVTSSAARAWHTCMSHHTLDMLIIAILRCGPQTSLPALGVLRQQIGLFSVLVDYLTTPK